jgi:Thrombospondin type 3 repeat
MARWTWTTASAGLAAAVAALAGLGCGEDQCNPACRPAFECYFGTCIPSTTDGGTDDVAPADDGRDEFVADGNPDIDGDGIPNATDNCPMTPNADQLNCDGDAEGDACDADDDNDGIPDEYDLCTCGPPPASDHDEDGDGLVDECDDCPEVPNADQVDGDGDRIGDACELPGDPSRVHERVAFLTFVESASWVAESGSWWRRDDMLGQDQLFGSASAYDTRWTFGDDVMVRTFATWGDGADTTYRLAGVLLRVDASSPPADWYYCCANAIGGTVQIWSLSGGAFDLIAEAPLSTTIEPGTAYGIVGAAFGSNLSCFVDRDGIIVGTTNAAAGLPLSGGIGLRTYGTAATFSSVTAYR